MKLDQAQNISEDTKQRRFHLKKSVILATSNMCRQDLQEQQQAKGKTYVSMVELLPVKKGNKDRMNY